MIENRMDAPSGSAGRHPLIGYFDAPGQEGPTYNPGLNAPCVVCYKPLSAPLKTISMMMPGDHRSYFYRAHKACYEALSEKEVADLEWSMMNPKAAEGKQ